MSCVRLHRAAVLLAAFALASTSAHARYHLDAQPSSGSRDSGRWDNNRSVAGQSDDDDAFFGGIHDAGLHAFALSFLPSKRDQLETGQGFGLAWTGNLGERYGAELSVSRYTEGTKDGPNLVHGQNVVWPIVISGRFYPFGHGQLEPYLVGGGGYYMITHRMDSDVNDQLALFGASYDEQVDGDFGLEGGAGLQIRLRRDGRMALDIDYRYVRLRPTAHYTLDLGSVKLVGQNDIDLGGSVVKGGLSFFF